MSPKTVEGAASSTSTSTEPSSSGQNGGCQRAAEKVEDFDMEGLDGDDEVAKPTCPKCLSCFATSGLHRPKLLPCTHVLCAQCVDGGGAAGGGGVLQCVFCEEMFPEIKKASMLKDAALVLEQLTRIEFEEATRCTKKQLQCDICLEISKLEPEEGEGTKTTTTTTTINSLAVTITSTPALPIIAPASHRCLHCPVGNQWLCARHAKEHRVIHLFKSHEVVDKKDFEQEDVFAKLSDANSTFKCKEHPGEGLTLYCATCKKMICHLCSLLPHKAHSVSEISPAAEMQTKQMIGTVQQVKEAREWLKKTLNAVNREEFMLVMEKGKTVEEAKQYIHLMEAKVEELKSSLVSKVSSEFERREKDLEKYRKRAENTLCKIENALKFSEQLWAHPNRANFLDSLPVLQGLSESFETSRVPIILERSNYNFLMKGVDKSLCGVAKEAVKLSPSFCRRLLKGSEATVFAMRPDGKQFALFFERGNCIHLLEIGNCDFEIIKFKEIALTFSVVDMAFRDQTLLITTDSEQWAHNVTSGYMARIAGIPGLTSISFVPREKDKHCNQLIYFPPHKSIFSSKRIGENSLLHSTSDFLLGCACREIPSTVYHFLSENNNVINPAPLILISCISTFGPFPQLVVLADGGVIEVSSSTMHIFDSRLSHRAKIRVRSHDIECIAVDETHRRIFAAVGNEIQVYNFESDLVVTTISHPLISSPKKLAVDPSKYLYIWNANGDLVQYAFNF